ncbi:MAG TPA: sulfatase-like hydrolase/transferase [Pirellulales bacterium]
MMLVERRSPLTVSPIPCEGEGLEYDVVSRRDYGRQLHLLAGPIDSLIARQKKPNILVIFGDDIGISNISVYSDGLMGYETPHIDRLASQGIRFLHYYAEQSCTAGRASFLTGQHGIRTGLTKVGFPGAPMGMSQRDPSIGGLLKNLGYATGQFGKNHVGDRNETLPTVNGFDHRQWPAHEHLAGRRHDTGALTKKRMETIDDETTHFRSEKNTNWEGAFRGSACASSCTRRRTA